MDNEQKDCGRCGALLAADEGICPTCGTVFGNRTEFQMPQVTHDMIQGAQDEAATMAMSTIPDDYGEAATIAMAVIPDYPEFPAGQHGPPAGAPAHEEAATIAMTAISFDEDYATPSPARQNQAPPGAPPAGPVFVGPMHLGGDSDERNVVGMVVGACVAIGIVVMLLWFVLG